MELVRAAADASAAYAAGEAPPKTRNPLIGQPFMLRLPFGCNGPNAATRQAQVSVHYDAAKKTVRLAAQPGDWKGLPILQAGLQTGEAEAMEGFWVPRSWSYSDDCPARNHDIAASPTLPSPPSLGLVRIFEAGSSRVLRRDGRAYEFTRRVPDNDPSMLSHGYRLVLEGRIAGFADGAALKCRAETSDHRPVCIYAVELDRLAFENAEDGKTLAEWRE